MAHAMGVSDRALSLYMHGLKRGTPPSEKFVRKLEKLVDIDQYFIFQGETKAQSPLITAYSGLDAGMTGAIKTHIKRMDILRVHGDAMSPLLENGDFVFVEKESLASSGDVVAVRYGGEIVLRHLLRDHARQRVTLVPVNPKYGEYALEQGMGVEILGVVRGKFVAV